MQTSIYLAKLIGPVLAVAGLGVLVNRKAFMEMAREFVGSTALVMFSGFLALPLGLAIVNAHNIWVAGWPVIITILGWMAILGGIVRIVMPQTAQSFAINMLERKNFITIEAIVLVAIGGWLSYAGYMI
jgi:hypothetical protein